MGIYLLNPLIRKAFKRLQISSRNVFVGILSGFKAFHRHKCPAGLDETYIKFRGKWKYLYRVVDTGCQMLDSLLTARRDAAAALLLQGYPFPTANLKW
ncbi:transposase [Serratia sp. M24T3]|nr:transposase [Serratia sp. M24T3]